MTKSEHTPATDAEIAAMLLEMDTGWPSAGDDQTRSLIARIRSEREATIRECAEKDVWQPIDSAPKDGASFVALIWYESENASYPEYVILQWDMLENDGWCDQSGFIVEDILPTHWRPLPTPPVLLDNPAKGESHE